MDCTCLDFRVFAQVIIRLSGDHTAGAVRVGSDRSLVFPRRVPSSGAVDSVAEVASGDEVESSDSEMSEAEARVLREAIIRTALG